METNQSELLFQSRISYSKLGSRSGFQFQMSAVRIQSSSKRYLLLTVEKTKVKKKEARNGPFLIIYSLDCLLEKDFTE